MTSLVIDLRNNGGGLLDESIEIANFFLPRGKTLVTTKGKIKQASNTYKTLREPLIWKFLWLFWSMAERLLRQKSLRALCRTLTVRSLSVTVLSVRDWCRPPVRCHTVVP